MEAGGVLNPAAVRGPDGRLYLLYRMATRDNYSRIGLARVLFNPAGDPAGVERLGIALEPEADYELRPDGGGCEDPRVIYVEPLRHYVMTYVAHSPQGPRIAVARSADLLQWERVGLAKFNPYGDIEFEGIDNKDSCVFPRAIANPSGQAELALLHRPLFPGTRPEELKLTKDGKATDVNCESIWISYCPLDVAAHLPVKGTRFTSHHRLAAPVAPWEKLKIGCGTPPVLTRHGWLIIYHGVHATDGTGQDKQRLIYSAGLMILARDNPASILYRSAEPILKPELPEEQVGLVSNVVFPTGIDQRTDIGMPDRFDVYYGMADDRIGVARLDLPGAF